MSGCHTQPQCLFAVRVSLCFLSVCIFLVCSRGNSKSEVGHEEADFANTLKHIYLWQQLFLWSHLTGRRLFDLFQSLKLHHGTKHVLFFMCCYDKKNNKKKTTADVLLKYFQTKYSVNKKLYMVALLYVSCLIIMKGRSFSVSPRLIGCHAGFCLLLKMALYQWIRTDTASEPASSLSRLDR